MTAALRATDWDDQDTPWPEARMEALRRSSGRCVANLGRRCGTWAHSVHHKLRRSQGGGNDQANLLPVCIECHTRIHDHPAEAFALGFLLPSRPTSKQPLFQRRRK